MTSNIDPEGLIPKIGDSMDAHRNTVRGGCAGESDSSVSCAAEMGVDLGVWCCGSSGRGARVAYIRVALSAVRGVA